MPKWIRYAAKIGLVGRDMHKTGETMIPEAGGVVVVTAIFTSLIYYAVLKICLAHDQQSMMYILGAIGSILCVTVIGVMDDFQGWKEGLKQWQKPLLTVPAAIPFLLATFERTTVDLPFLGVQNVGLAVPLVFVPLGIVGASNAFNMLAGYNGLEAGMGVIMLGTFGLLAHLGGHHFGAVFCLIGVSALVAFLIFNWYPSKVFPGDTLTYPIGAYLAICAVLGHVVSYALILFIPYYLDFLLPLRKRMKVEAFAKINGEGGFEQPYKGIYDTTHLVIFLLRKIKRNVYERDVVLFILGFELLLAILCVIIFAV
jgi:UDP-N-acetylglucosamine--dolichyl-phosphate N-acetylglucosaminephosphotransferase